MTIYLRKSTASQEILIGMLLDDDDGVTPKTGLTIANSDIILWKHGGTGVAAKNSGGATEISGGYYYATLDDTDTNTLGNLIIHVKVTDALMWRQECLVVSENFFDTMCSTDKFDVNVAEVSGDSTAADNAESFFDGTGYAGTNNVIPLVTVATTATNLTNLPAITADWLTATGVKADAVTKIQNGLATPTNITAGTITTVTNLTNAPINGDLTATMKSSVTAAVPTAAAISDAVWDEASTGHTDAGKAGAQVWTDIDAILEDTGTTLPATLDTIDNFLDTEIAAILADTNELQTDWVNGGRLDLILDSAASAGDPWSTALPGAYGAGTAGLLLGTTIPAAIDTIDNFLDTEVAAILADTNELQTDWTNGGRLDLLLDGAASAGDPWTTTLPGAYGAGTAGKIVGDNLNAPVATIDTVVDAIKVVTDAIGATGSGLSAIPWNAAWDAEVQSECNDALIANNLDHLLLTPVAEDMTDQCADGSIFGRFLTGGDTSDFISTDSVIDVRAAIVALAADVGDAGVGSSLVSLVGDVTTELAKVPKSDSNVTFNATALASVADAVWDEASTGHTDAGKAGAQVWTDIDAILEDTSTTLDDLIDSEIAALTTELAKVPKSDSNVTWNATALASINAEVDTALNTAIPGSPTSDSINERVKAIDDLTQASGSGDLAAILTDTGTTLDGLIDDIKALVGGYSLSSPVFDTDGNMTSATITANGKTYTVTATYDVDTNLATYAIVGP